MNKQELEKQAEALYTDVRSFLDNTFELIDKIHEPQKVVVPKFIGDLIEELKIGKYTIGEIGVCVYDDEEQKWIDDNEELFYRAFLDG